MISQAKWALAAHICGGAIPLLVIPILISRLGLNGFASFAILSGITQYAALLVELGLNQAAMSETIKAKNETKDDLIFTEVLIIKIGLALAVCLFVSLAVSATSLAEMVSYKVTVILMAGPALTCILYPVWHYTVLNKQAIVFTVNMATRISTLVGVYFFVGENEYELAVFIFNYASLPFSIVFSYIWVRKIAPVKQINFRRIVTRFKSGILLSSTMMKESISNAGIAPIAALFLPVGEIATFTLFEKIAKALSQPAPILSSIAMVSLSDEVVNSICRLTRSKIYAATIMMIGALVALCATILIYFGFVYYFPDYSQHWKIMAALMLAVPLVYINYFYLSLFYIRSGNYYRASLMSVIYIVFLGLVAVILFFLYGQNGISAALFISELMLLCLLTRCHTDMFSTRR